MKLHLLYHQPVFAFHWLLELSPEVAGDCYPERAWQFPVSVKFHPNAGVRIFFKNIEMENELFSFVTD